jgi:Tol biopolymer transport system component/DNA-binding winged helix-turn-helix (wHTH) protein
MNGRNAEVLRFGPFRFVPGDGLWRGADEVALPPRALGALATLIARRGVVASKQELMDAVWPDTFVTESSLLEAIGLLREALGDDRRQPIYIQTVHRRGYRFIARVEPAEPSEPSEPSEPVRFFSGPEWRPLVAASAAAVTATIGMAVVFALFGQHPIERRTSRFSIALPTEATVDPLRGSVAVSADGTRMVYVATIGGRQQLALRTIDRDEPVPIDGSDGASDPFFSPDGEWVGFFAGGSLQKIPAMGGVPTLLCAARAGLGAVWSADGTIVFGGGPGGGLARVSANGVSAGGVSTGGGEPVVLASPLEGSRELRYGWPDLLPNDRGIIYTAVGLATSDVFVLDLRTGARTRLVSAASFGRYSPTGHLIVERRGRLEAAPFSLATLTTTEPTRPIVSGVATSDALDSGPRFAFSRSGSLVYVPGAPAGASDTLHWLDGRGQLERVPLPAAALGDVELAPDQQRLALTMDGEAGPDLWVGDLNAGALHRLTEGGQSISPAWRPDGLEIAFAYSKAGPFNLFLKPIDGSAEAARLLTSPWNQFPTSWAPNSRQLAFTEFQPLTGADIWVLDLDTRERRPVVRTLFDEASARFSPDGRWMAYMSTETGRWEVYVRDARGGSARLQVSRNGGRWPCWSVDGRTLYFDASGRTTAVAIQTSPTLTASAPFEIPGASAMVVAGNGQPTERLLVRRTAGSISSRELRVVLEWFTELSRLVHAS